MEEMKRRRHVPTFGSWDYNDDLPFTQCFESARQTAAELRMRNYGYSAEDRDLYVAGDLYDHDIVTPAVIIVPRRRPAKGRYPIVNEAKKREKRHGYGIKEPPSPVHDEWRSSSSPSLARKFPKAVDEDLYKIPPELLYAKPRRKRGFGRFSSCLLPVCV